MFNILQINYYNAIDKVKTFQVKVILQIRDEYCWEEKLLHQNEVNNHPLWHLLSVSHYSLPATNALDLVPHSWDFHMLMQYKKEKKKRHLFSWWGGKNCSREKILVSLHCIRIWFLALCSENSARSAENELFQDFRRHSKWFLLHNADILSR